MTIRKEDVEAIAGEAIQSWREDEDVREYLLSILTEEDSYHDAGNLKATLLPFVGDSEEEVVSKMVDRLKELIHPDELRDSDNRSETVDNITPTLLGEVQPLAQASVREIKVAKSSKEAVDTSSSKKDRRTKRQERLQKKRQGKAPTKETHKQSSEETTEDDASAWRQRQSEGKSWGGRGFGGRGEYAGKVNHIKSNIHLANVTVSLPNGADLLQNTTMDISANHRYGLIGRNGVGKSTLLNRLACRMIPGMPDMRILVVQQQVEGSDKTPVEVLLEADVDRAQLLAEEEELETALESGSVSETEIEQIAERLSHIVVELDAIGADSAESRANEILNGLQFTQDMLQKPTINLSGGWRMRLALARALFVPCDLLLLDECTNHLDLHGLDWLIKYLTSDDSRTMIIVSHDRSFLDAVCTDILRMDHMQLSYHVGNYSEYERQMAEKSARDAQILGAAERQRAKAEAFVQKQQAMANKKSADPNKQRQAKMIKEKKMERIGNYREDGKRYKNFSLKQLDESHVRLAQKVHIEIDEPVIKMNFPEPLWPPGIAPGDGIVRTEGFSFGYDTKRTILNDITVEIRRGSKIALVGVSV
uniref:ABC transporter domain-containing protein n=1 Tax=Amphora coffeiformis TaxID=265554 RepID=A0A7S3KXI9_9STRA